MKKWTILTATALTAAMLTASAAQQVFVVEVIPQPTPAPIYRPLEELPRYDLSKADVETLAKLLWSSPLREECYKERLLWCVLNRVDRYEKPISEVVVKSEFGFYDRHARISDRNRDIVERVMQRWLAEKDGYGIGKRPPKSALYCRFAGEYNRQIQLLESPEGRELKW